MMEELKPMDLGTLFDKIFRVIFNKKSIFFNLSFFLIFNIFAVIFLIINNLFFNKFLFTVEDYQVILINLAIFIVLFFFYLIFQGISQELYYYNFFKKKQKIQSSILKSLKKLPGLLFYNFLCLIILGVLIFLSVFIIWIFDELQIVAEIDSILKFITYDFILFFLIIFFCLIFVGIYFFANLFFLLILPVMLIENKNVFKAITRSIKLITYNFFRIYGTVILLFFIGIVTYIIFYIIIILIIIMIYLLGSAMKITIDDVVYTWSLLYSLIFCGLLIYMPLNSFYVIIFLNQKIIHENFGLELLIMDYSKNNIK